MRKVNILLPPENVRKIDQNSLSINDLFSHIHILLVYVL